MSELDISKNGRYDLTRVSNSEVSQESVTKNKAKLIKVFEKFDINGDGKLNSVELAAASKYFAALDKDSDKDVLSKQELEDGAATLNQQLQLSGKDALKGKDIKAFIENLTTITQNDEQIDIDNLLSFNNDDNANLNLENLSNAEVIDTENGKKYVFVYKDGTKVNLNPDKSYDITTKDAQNNTETNFYNNKNALTQTQTQYYNNDSETTTYIVLENGQSIPSQTTQTTKNGTVESVLTYSNGVPVSEIIKNKSEELYYATLDDGQMHLIRKTDVNSKQVTDYTYNDNNTVTAETSLPGKTITQIMKTAGDESSVVMQTVKEETDNGVVTTDTIYSADGKLERIKSQNETVVNQYNEINKKISSSITKNGKTYQAKYDGNGNTYLVMTMYDKIGDIAKACDVTPEELFKLNEGLYKGSGANKYFLAGQEIKVPAELEPDCALLKNRGTSEQEASRFNAWDTQQKELKKEANDEVASRQNCMARDQKCTFNNYEQLAKWLYTQEGVSKPSKYQINTRTEELKKLNPNTIDGSLANKTVKIKWNPEKEAEISRANIDNYKAQYNKKSTQEHKEGKVLAKNLKDYLNDHSFSLKDKEFRAILNKVNSKNVIGVLEEYKSMSSGKSLLDAMNDEWGDESDACLHIFNALQQRAKDAGVVEKYSSKHFLTTTTQRIWDDTTGQYVNRTVKNFDFDKFK